jgi:hypothetical protein
MFGVEAGEPDKYWAFAWVCVGTVASFEQRFSNTFHDRRQIARRGWPAGSLAVW